MVETSAILQAFRRAFPQAPAPRLCRAPGRINLLGEHLDYNGLPVLPMPIDRGVTMAYAPLDEPAIQVTNADPRFAAHAIDLTTSAPPTKGGHWGNYIRAAVEALHPHLPDGQCNGMALYVDSTLPPAAGLSSSTALLIAAAMAFADVNDMQHGFARDPLFLAEILAKGERFLGTEGGAMDHAVILGGSPGHAAKIDFNPLRLEQVPLFPDHVFVVAHSLVEAAKAGDGGAHYNTGPRLCEIARAFLEKAAQEEFDDEIELPRIADLWLGPLCLTHDEAAQLFRTAFPQERYTTTAIGRRLNIGENELTPLLPAQTEPTAGWPLRAHARHVFTEYQRVELGRDTLLANDPASFGKLMNASHQSCAHDMAVSCDALDRLAQCAMDAGALGARMTGAGGGGSCIALVRSDHVSTFVSRLNDSFYAGSATEDQLFPAANCGAAAYAP